MPFVDLKAQYQSIQDEITAAMSQTLSGMELQHGPNVRAFESEFAAYCDVGHAVGVASGTDAVYLALRASGVRPGDEVITVSNTFIATVEAIIQVGAQPVFVDIDPDTYTLDPSLLKAALGPHTRAILPVHLYGQMADVDSIVEFADRHGLVVVEDACQAHGAMFLGRRSGSVGEAAAFSFYVSKNLGAYGEGGAVTTNSQAVAAEVRMLRDHGSKEKYHHQQIGVNSRLDELQAAVLRVKLQYLDSWNDKRKAHAQAYRQYLGDTGVRLPTVRSGADHVYHLYVIRVDERDRVRQVLADRGVATGIHYPIPIHLQPACRGIGRISGNLRVTEEWARRVISLPMYPELEMPQIRYVANCLHAVCQTRVA